MVNNIPVNGWPQLKDLEAVQPILNRLDKIEAWKRTVKEETFTGEVITIDNALALPARSLKTTINAIQDLHGYDKPWAGGAYKNKLPLTVARIKAINNSGTWSNNEYTFRGVVFGIATDDAGNVIYIEAKSGTATGGNANLNLAQSLTIASNGVMNGCTNGDFDTYYIEALSNSQYYHSTNGDANVPSSFDSVWIGIKEGYAIPTGGIKFYPMIRLSTESDATFAPYSNLCPISGRTAVVLTRSDGDEISEDFTIQLGQTVYGADINWDTGVATVDRKIYTFSGTGEDWTLDGKRFKFLKPSDWAGESAQYANPDKVISNQATLLYNDVYGAYFSITNGWLWVNALDSSETLASFRARLAETPIQIVGMLATPTTIQLTPAQLELLKGYNHITLTDGYGTIEFKALTGANWS